MNYFLLCHVWPVSGFSTLPSLSFYIFIMRSYTRYTQTQANNNNDNNNKRKKRTRKIRATVQLTTQTTRPTQYIMQQLVSVRQKLDKWKFPRQTNNNSNRIRTLFTYLDKIIYILSEITILHWLRSSTIIITTLDITRCQIFRMICTSS